MNLILTLISLVIFASYTIVVWRKFKPLPDLSSSYYFLKKGYLFQIMMVVISLLLIIPVMDLRDSDFKLFDFLIFTGTIYVAVAPAYREKLEGKVHTVSALISAFSAVIVAVLAGYWYIPFIYFLVASLLIDKMRKSKIFFLEMVCFLSIYTILIINYI